MPEIDPLEQVEEILESLLPPKPDYNRGLLPDEEGYSGLMEIISYDREATLYQAKAQLQQLIEREKRRELEQLQARHIEVCRVTFPENERDNCAYDRLVIERLADLNNKEDSALISEENYD